MEARARRWHRALLGSLLLAVLPLLLAMHVLGLWTWDLSVPLVFMGSDDVWQFVLTKVLRETGWVLWNPSLGAPGIASWHHNASAQTSAIHSVLMLALSPFVHDAVRLQQIYYLLNFPLICFTSYLACRLLGIARLPAVCVGFLFAFSSFRITEMLYAYLANYFAVPLAIVAVVWVMIGRLVKEAEAAAPGGGWPTLRALLRSRDFLLGLLFVMLVGAADGYYAFFTLLLLGFALLVRVLLRDGRHAIALVPGIAYIGALLATAFALQLPLNLYKHQHPEEFAPGGVVDSSLIKHPFEAEIYSASLKMLVSPIPNHRIAPLAELGTWMIATSDDARRVRTGRAIVPLGTLGTVLLFGALLALAVPALRRGALHARARLDPPPLHQAPHSGPEEPVSVPDALLALVLFALLCSVAGGIGTLVALVFPTIRAYDRFALFLLFVLLLCWGWLTTDVLRRSAGMRRLLLACGVVVVTAVALWDQVPGNAQKGTDAIRIRFLAERAFVQRVEAALPPGAMVYNFPYSQYLRDSRHYGWGSFAHVRLYLHSRQLHWSNGAAKNSPVDLWHESIANLPPAMLLPELEAAGFQAMVIDTGVLKPDETALLRRSLDNLGYVVQEDRQARLQFVRLQDRGLRLNYDSDYRNIATVEITDPRRVGQGPVPRLLDRGRLVALAAAQPAGSRVQVRRDERPELFLAPTLLRAGIGDAPIPQLSDVRGHLRCGIAERQEGGRTTRVVELRLANGSSFDWLLNSGRLPIRLGVHVRGADGAMLLWDNGFRVPGLTYVARGSEETILLPTHVLAGVTGFPIGARLEFALVQDGNAWYAPLNCAIPLAEVK